MPQEKPQIPPSCMVGVEVKKHGTHHHHPDAPKKRICCFCMCGEKADDTLASRQRRRKFVNGCLYSLAVCVGLIGYTFLGAVLFVQIEGDGEFVLSRAHPPKAAEKTHEWPADFGDSLRNKAVENIWEITVNLNILYRENWTRLAALEIARFQEQLAHELARELEDESAANESHDKMAASQWDLASGLLYSITILTTTGYGKLGPKTVLGKTATMLYAAVGIPLMLVYLSSIGQLLSTCAMALFRRQGRPPNKGAAKSTSATRLEPFYIRAPPEGDPRQGGDPRHTHCSDTLHKSPSISINSSHYAGTPTGSLVQPHSKGTFSTVLCFGVMIAYICCGALIVCLLEKNWSYLDGVFFCFMTLSTINFVDGGGGGDGKVMTSSPTPSLPPTAAPHHSRGAGDPTTVWFFSLYILWGMALTAMCFNIFHREVVYRLDYSTAYTCHQRPLPGSAS